jgi:hypothetical protein
VRLINLGTDEKLAGLVKIEEQVDVTEPGDSEDLPE